MLYYEGLLNYVTGDQQAGMAKVQRAKQIYRLCGNKFMVEQMEMGLEALQDV